MSNPSPLRDAHEELEAAIDDAGSVVRNQLQSVEEGIAEEVGGERTQDDPGPKADRVAELEEKLDGLVAEAEEPTRSHVEAARDHLRAFRHRESLE